MGTTAPIRGHAGSHPGRDPLGVGGGVEVEGGVLQAFVEVDLHIPVQALRLEDLAHLGCVIDSTTLTDVCSLV